MPRDQVIRTSYRVDVMLPHNMYAEYTSAKGVDLGFATALGNYLKWRKAGGRIVELPSGLVVDEWKRKYTPYTSDDFSNEMTNLKDRFGF